MIVAPACVALSGRADPVASIEYVGRVAVGHADAMLSASVVARNRSRRVVELEPGSQCRHPQPLILRHEASGRVTRWDENTWHRARADTVYCTDDPMMHRLASGDSLVFALRRLPVRALLGDSLPTGWYTVDVGAFVLARTPDGAHAAGPGTLLVRGGHVHLP